MRKNKVSICLSGLLLIVTTQACADDDNATMGEMEAIQARNMLLEAQVQTARLKRQLRESEVFAQPGSVGTDPVSPVPFRTPTTSVVTPAGTPTAVPEGRLRLQEIYGRGEKLRARIFLSTGGVIDVSRGDAIPGSHLTVSAVTDSSVRLSDGSSVGF